IALLVPVLFLVSVLIWAFVYFVPGDPALTLAGEYATAEQVEVLRERLGLDDPIIDQYARSVGGALHGDLGESLFSGRCVTSAIVERLPVTLSRPVGSLLIAVLIAIPAATVAALHRGRVIDRIATVGASLGLAVPSFWLGLMLVLLLSLRVGWFPTSGY